MILTKTPLSLAHVKGYVQNIETNPQFQDYLKAFCKISKEDAEKLAADVRALNNPKIREEFLVKIIDFCPRDIEELNKLSVEVSLTEEEANAILALVKNY